MKYIKHALLCITCCITLSLAAHSQAKSAAVINQELSANRKKIDSLDKLLIAVLGNRQRIVQEIGVYKKKNNVPPLQPARFKEVVDRAIAAGSKEGLSADFITELMNAIHKESLRMEGDTTVKN
nr:chorismate mutase [uncultured Mucilaginibacter sp.]